MKNNKKFWKLNTNSLKEIKAKQKKINKIFKELNCHKINKIKWISLSRYQVCKNNTEKFCL